MPSPRYLYLAKSAETHTHAFRPKGVPVTSKGLEKRADKI